MNSGQAVVFIVGGPFGRLMTGGLLNKGFWEELSFFVDGFAGLWYC